MRQFFYPSSMAVFGVADNPRNLARNIVANSLACGFKGDIYPVGREPGTAHGKTIITDPWVLPEGIDLAVILVPAKYVAETLDICGEKGIRHAVISTGGFRELTVESNEAEQEMLRAAKRHGIRFIGPNCIGVICTQSGICTPFNPMQPRRFKKGPVGLIVQSGGVTTQSAYTFSEEHVGFSKIISAGNKLDLDEIDFLEYLLKDEETEQIHMYLESIEDGREFLKMAKGSKKPIVVFKSNVSRTASEIAYSHTAALSNNETVVDGALKQAGIVRVGDIHEMTVAAKALQLPPLRGDRLVVISLSGGYSVILGDACERYGFTCPPLPRELMDQIEGSRRAGVIRMSNPMDFGDVHDVRALIFALEACLTLDIIDGVVLSFMYEPEMTKIFGAEIGSPEQMVKFAKGISRKNNKPVALSFFSERRHLEAFNKLKIFPVFNDPVESVFALRLLRDYGLGKDRI
ncbi:MAG: CoA-binding protein [Deltaproteobacteria bacterium]|nr:CoA-binding protein [Deltaproteobacteria bacterium]